ELRWRSSVSPLRENAEAVRACDRVSSRFRDQASCCFWMHRSKNAAEIERARIRVFSRRKLARQTESLMKVHLMQPEILLLQAAGDTRHLVREQRSQVAFLASNHHPHVIEMHDGAHFHIAEGGGDHADPHLRLRRLVDDLRDLYRPGSGSRNLA